MQAAGVTAGALDLAPEMAEYARENTAQRGLELDYLVADMTRFESSRRFELAACMLCSGTYLLTDAALSSHLGSVHAALADDGMYVLELPHPGAVEKPRTGSKWTMRDDGGELFVEWLEDDAAREGNTWVARVRLEYRPFDGRTKASRSMTKGPGHAGRLAASAVTWPAMHWIEAVDGSDRSRGTKGPHRALLSGCAGAQLLVDEWARSAD